MWFFCASLGDKVAATAAAVASAGAEAPDENNKTRQ
jgi:hypothetical protein